MPVAATPAEPNRLECSAAEPVAATPAAPERPRCLATEEQRSFDRHYWTNCELDCVVIGAERRRVFARFELGRIATKVKERLPHGKWLPWLDEHGYNARYVQRAIQIFVAFENHEEDLAGLTMTEALQFGTRERKDILGRNLHHLHPLSPPTDRGKSLPTTFREDDQARGHDANAAVYHAI